MKKRFSDRSGYTKSSLFCISYMMTTFEWGPVKKFDNLKIKTPEETQAEQDALIKTTTKKQEIKTAAAIDAEISWNEANILQKKIEAWEFDVWKETTAWKNSDVTINGKDLQYYIDHPEEVTPEIRANIQLDMKKRQEALAQKTDKAWETNNTWEKQNTIAKKPLWFLDGFKTLFDSPLASEFKAIFYNMMALFGKEGDKDKYTIEAAFSEAEQKISKLNKEEKVIDKAWNELTYIRALKLLTLWKNDENMQDLKRRFAWAWIDQQKAYIAAAIKDPDNKELLNILGQKVDKPSEAKDEKENPNIIKVKGLDDKNYPDWMPVEIKWEGDDKYVKMGTHLLVPIINNEIRFYMWVDGGKQAWEKIMTVTKDDQWNTILSSAKDWKNYPSSTDKILVDATKEDLTKDDNKFNLWVSLSTWIWESIFTKSNQWKAELILTNWKKQLILMPKEQRIPVILKEKAEKLKSDLFPYVADNQKEIFKNKEIKLAFAQQWS